MSIVAVRTLAVPVTRLDGYEENPLDRRRSTQSTRPFCCAEEVGLDDMEVAPDECKVRDEVSTRSVGGRTPNLYAIVTVAALAVICVGGLDSIASNSALHFRCC